MALLLANILVFCLLGYITAADGGWSAEIPSNCPHTDSENHVCSTLQTLNTRCCTRHCCYGTGQDSSSEDGEHRRKRGAGHHWGHFEGHHHEGCRICWTCRPCTYYRCESRCCDGYCSNWWGQCIADPNSIQCENGGTPVRGLWGIYVCKCPEGFQGSNCQTPICDCVNGGLCEVKDGRPYCDCPDGYYGNKCENANCTTHCYNGGVCYKFGEDEFCKCTEAYIGKQCEKLYVHPETCPPPEYDDDLCESGCTGNEDCETGQVCCKEGCSTVCREPKVDYCVYENQRYPVGENFSPDTCSNCTCIAGGNPACVSVSCAEPQCAEGLEPETRPGTCCPTCPDPDPPALTGCPPWTVPVNTLPDSDGARITRQIVPVNAYDYKGDLLQVIYTPEFVAHCHCPPSSGKEISVQAYATDQYGNTGNCVFRVAVRDKQSPRFLECPKDKQVTEGDVVTWVEPLYEDNVGVMVVDRPSGNGQKFPVGKHDMVYTITDFDGNNATCRFAINVTRAPPKFTDCPTNFIFLNASSNSARAYLNDRTVPLHAYDAAGQGLLISYQPQFLDHCNCSGTPPTLVSATAVDQHGSVATCSFKVIVRDVTPPSFLSCPRDIYTTEGNSVVWMDPEYTDNVGVARVSGWNQRSGAVFPVGNHTVYFEVWDMENNKATCKFTIFVTKEEPRPPTMLNCPVRDDVIDLSTDLHTDIVRLDGNKTSIEAYDYENRQLLVMFEPPTVRHCHCYDTELSRTDVLATAYDHNGISVSCRFTVRVWDNEKPAFHFCPQDIEVTEGQPAYWDSVEPYDNVQVAARRSTVLPDDRVLPVGITIVEYIAQDYDRNTEYCRFNVTVKEEKCSLQCLNGGTCEKAASHQCCSCPPDFIGRLCEFKYDQPATCPDPEPQNDTGGIFCLSDRDCGSGYVCCKDGCTSRCKKQREIYCEHNGRRLAVNEQYSPHPCTNCTCSPDGTLECSTQSCGMLMCQYDRQPVLVPGQCCLTCPENQPPPPPPLTLVNCPAKTVHLNTAKDTDVALITVEETKIQAFDVDGTELEVFFKPSFVRHCACYDAWTEEKEVTAYATDKYGNVASCTFSITVRDPHEPRFLSCPQDIYVFEDEPVSWREPEVFDNVEVAEKRCSSERNGQIFTIGSHSVTYTAWDYDGNTASCFFMISVSPRGLKPEEMPQVLREKTLRKDNVRLGIILPAVFGALLAVVAALLLLYCCRRKCKSRPSSQMFAKDKKSPPPYTVAVVDVPKKSDPFKPKRKGSSASKNGKPGELTPESLAYHNAVYARPLTASLELPPYSLYSQPPPAYSVTGSVAESVTGRSLKDVTYVALPPSYINPGYETLSVYSQARSEASSRPRSAKSSRSASSRRSSRT